MPSAEVPSSCTLCDGAKGEGFKMRCRQILTQTQLPALWLCRASSSTGTHRLGIPENTVYCLTLLLRVRRQLFLLGSNQRQRGGRRCFRPHLPHVQRSRPCS